MAPALVSAGPVPQTGLSGRDDPSNYFGGIYIGSDEEEEEEEGDYGEYNPGSDYFGGISVGNERQDIKIKLFLGVI